MQQADVYAPQKSGSQFFVHVLHRGQIACVVLRAFYSRANNISLPPFADFLLHIVVYKPPPLRAAQKCSHRQTAGGHFANEGNFQITVQCKGHGSGNGRCGHYQNIRRNLTFLLQGCALLHAETMLFVRNRQPQAGKGHVLLNEGVSADYNVKFMVFYGGANFVPLAFGHSPRQKANFNGQLGKKFPKSFKMLRRQNFRGSHKRTLTAVFDGFCQSKGGYYGFARPHIALHQAAHGFYFFHVGANILPCPLLVAG